MAEPVHKLADKGLITICGIRMFGSPVDVSAANHWKAVTCVQCLSEMASVKRRGGAR